MKTKIYFTTFLIFLLIGLGSYLVGEANYNGIYFICAGASIFILTVMTNILRKF